MAATDMEKQPLLVSERRQSAQADSEPESAPSLSELQQDVFRAQRAYMQAWSKTKGGKWHRRVVYVITAFLTTLMLFWVVVIAADFFSGGLEDDVWTGPRKVPLEAHIMSKCPDARDCLHDLILPTMQRVGHQVDFTLSYIGSETHDDDGVLCMHGPTECLGNVIELCAANLYPNPRIYLGFTMCLTKDYQEIPAQALVEDCALEHGISMQKLNDCAISDDGEWSLERLKQSFRRSQAANVTKSCTVRLDGDIRCIRDGGEWKDCDGGHRVEDLVRDIMNLTTVY